VTDALAPDLAAGIRAYVLEHGDDLSFTKYFWRGCEPLEVDVIQYWKFTNCLRLQMKEPRLKELGKMVHASPATVYTWCKLLQMPKLARYLLAFLELGEPPTGQLWLCTECSHGYGMPVGQFLALPPKIGDWDEIANVLSALKDINAVPSCHSRNYLFGFLLGMMVGDAAKSRSKTGSSHRHLGLVLSKKYDSNLRIGEFTVLCARSMGLRMHRTRDLDRPRGKPYGFYEWVSQSSPLVDWIFNTVFGLKDDELTTYNSVHAEWMLETPRDVRLGFIQGLAESDGSVNIASQTVEFWVDPHRGLLKDLLAMEGLRAFNNRQAISLAKSQAIAAFGVPVFSPIIQSVRYRRHQVMATARRLNKRERLSLTLRREIAELRRQGFSVPQIVERFAESHGLLVSFEAAQRWAHRPQPLEDSH
jgi:hypothetical protein